MYPPDRLSLPAMSGQITHPGHTITLLPTVLLVNLLPVDILFKITGGSGRVLAGSNAPITFVSYDLLSWLDLVNFPACRWIPNKM